MDRQWCLVLFVLGLATGAMAVPSATTGVIGLSEESGRALAVGLEKLHFGGRNGFDFSLAPRLVLFSALLSTLGVLVAVVGYLQTDADEFDPNYIEADPYGRIPGRVVNVNGVLRHTALESML